MNPPSARDAALPLVSIGIPLYNEAKFIEESLLSILDQDYGNVELIISDNASTDATVEICKKVIGDRENCRLHRFGVNKGAAENFRYVLSQAHGIYFMWASGHDLWDSNYIRECVNLLEAMPSAAIAFGSSSWIDEYGKTLNRYSGYIDTRGMHPINRFFSTYYGNMHPILGLIRRSFLNDGERLLATVGADLILLTDLALKGDFIHSSRTSWCRREFRHETSHGQKLQRYRSPDYGLARSMLDRYFPLLRIPLELLRNILVSDLSRAERVFVAISLLASLPIRYLAGKR